MLNDFYHDDTMATYRILGFGFLIGLAFNTAYIASVMVAPPDFLMAFPFSALSNAFAVPFTYIHEFGHTGLFWFYGYAAVPALDFQYGGGFTRALGGPIVILHLCLYVLLGYLFKQSKGHPRWRIFLVSIGIFHAATAHFEIHQAIVTMGGHLAEMLTLFIYLTFAWLDVNGHGSAKRLLYAAIGWGIGVRNAAFCYLLSFDRSYRHDYYNDKGGHAVHDLDRISEFFHTDFKYVVWTMAALTVAAVVIPYILYLRTLQETRSPFVPNTTPSDDQAGSL